MIGIQLEAKTDPADVKKRCLDMGLCVTTAGKDVIRLLPPLNITNSEINKGLSILKSALEQL